jgi:beta-galactosidase
VTLPVRLPAAWTESADAALTVSLVERSDTLWAKAGHEVAFGQFVVAAMPRAAVAGGTAAGTSALRLEETANEAVVSGTGFRIAFDKRTGSLASYTVQGVELLRAELRPNFWRAYTDNDNGNKLPERCATWREAGSERELLGCSVSKDAGGDRVVVAAQYLLPTTAPSYCSVTYTVSADGQVTVHEELLPGERLPEIPEVGVLLELDGSLQQLRWYGYGPHENHWDRVTGAKLGIYEGTVAGQYVPYLRPQECGNKTGVRWDELTREGGIGLRMEGLPTVELNALPYTPSELEACDHGYKLPASDKVALRVSFRQMGVGGDDSWRAKTHPDYTLYANRGYAFGFVLKPLGGK